MEGKSNSNEAPEEAGDVVDHESLLLDHMSVTRDFHFSFSSFKLKYDDEKHKLLDEKDMENRNQDQNINFDDVESMSISIRINESDLRLDQRNEPRSEFSLSSLDSNDFFDGIDSILVTKRRTSRKLQLRRVGTSNDSCFNESYESMQSSNLVR